MGEVDMSIIACPCCKHRLNIFSEKIKCDTCGSVYFRKKGIPILLNKNSLYSFEDIRIYDSVPSGIKQWIRNKTPRITCSWNIKSNYILFSQLLKKRGIINEVLVIGYGSGVGGFNNIAKQSHIHLIETDVCIAPRIKYVADAHDLPFMSESFDAVVIQAVLEHVLNPQQCVDEIYRVLKKGGLVYAHTSFMEPLHMKPYDFIRFTPGGHRWLFRNFSTVKMGINSGPGTVISLSLKYFLLSFSRRRIWLLFINRILPFFIFWLKYLDLFILNSEYASDSAGSVFFLGTKRKKITEDENKFYFQKMMNGEVRA